MITKDSLFQEESHFDSNISTINCHQLKYQNAFHNLIVISLYNSEQNVEDQVIQKIMLEAQKLSKNTYILIQTRKDFSDIHYFILLFDHYNNLCNVKQGMEIYVNGKFNHDNTIYFKKETKNDQFFVFEPKTLISATKLTNISFCRRKQFVKELIKNQSFGTNFNQLRGKFLHSLFQLIIQSINDYKDYFYYLDQIDINNLDSIQLPQQFNLLLEQIQQQFLQDIYTLNNQSNEYVETDIIQELVLQGLINSFIWIKKFVINQQPIEHSTFQQNKLKIQFLKWIANEKKISSQILGLVGVIDVVLEVKVIINNSVEKFCKIPIEIKTGLQHQSDETQVQVYLLLMNHLYKQETLFGIILYLNELDYKIVTYNQFLKNDLLFSRNLYISQLCQFLKKDIDYNHLPHLSQEIKNAQEQSKCQKCGIKYVCYGLNVLKKQSQLNFPIEDYQQIDKQLNEQTRNYLNNMLQNLRLEKQALIISQIDFEIKQKQKINESCETHYILSSKITFFKDQALQILKEYFSYNEELALFCSRTQKSYYFNLKTQPNIILKYLLNQTTTDGIILEEDLQYVIRMHVQVKKEQNIFWGSLELEDILTKQIQLYNPFKHYNFIIFEIAANNRWKRKKEILILGYTPYFKSLTQLYEGTQQIFASLLDELKSKLNEYQLKAIQLCLLSEDFALIQGDYGKRRMLSHLLYLLGYTNKKVLFCAADNEVLDEQINDFIETFPNQSDWILRLSNENEKDKIKEIHKKYSFDFKHYKDLSEIDKKLENKHFYFSTCLNCTDILQSEPFDYCIVDQSTKIIEPLCISCILKSKVFILLDDSEMQQPQIKSQKAKLLKISLFQRLSEQFKNLGCLVNLDQEINQVL